jgi:hypothetical protein
MDNLVVFGGIAAFVLLVALPLLGLWERRRHQ